MKTPVRKISEYDNCYVQVVGYEDKPDYFEYEVVVKEIIAFTFYKEEEAMRLAREIGETFIAEWRLLT